MPARAILETLLIPFHPLPPHQVAAQWISSHRSKRTVLSVLSVLHARCCGQGGRHRSSVLHLHHRRANWTLHVWSCCHLARAIIVQAKPRDFTGHVGIPGRLCNPRFVPLVLLLADQSILKYTTGFDCKLVRYR